MRRAQTSSTRPTARSRAVAPATALALASVLATAACGGRTDVSGGTSTGGGQTTADGSVTASPEPGTTTGDTGTTTATEPDSLPRIDGVPTDVPVPTLIPRTTATPMPQGYDGPVVTTGSRQDNLAAINATYDTFMANLTGLFRDLDPVWSQAVREVATPQMTLAVTRAAAAVQASKSHSRGTLRDARRSITIKGNEAQVLSCLDEQNWYVIKDGTGVPDPGIARGFFRGRATFVFAQGRWLVNTWNSLPQRCPAF